MRTLAALAALSLAAPASAQPAVKGLWVRHEFVFVDADPLDRETRDLARDRFELSRSSVADHLRARDEALAMVLDARFGEFLVGRGELDKLRDSLRAWRAARGEADGESADRRGVTRTAAALAAVIAEQTQARYAVGRGSRTDMLATRAEYLSALLAAKDATTRPAAPNRPAFRYWPDGSSPLDSGFWMRDVGWPPRRDAAEHFAVARRDPAALRRELLEVAGEKFKARQEEFFVGRGVLAFLIDELRDLRESPFESAADARRATTNYADQMVVKVRLSQDDFENHRYDESDLAHFVAESLDAWLRALDAGGPGGGLPVVSVPDGIDLGDWSRERCLPFADPVDLRETARARFEITHADRRTLLRQRRDAQAVDADARFRDFLVGRGTLDFQLASARKLADAELALAETPPARRAALERWWATARTMYQQSLARYEVGVLSKQDMGNVRAAYEDVCIRLLREERGPNAD